MAVRVHTDPVTGMNKTETRYAQRLELERLALGGLIRWRFEPIKFCLAKGCFYTPDFEIVQADGTLSYHEIKGFWRDDARVKIKVAARLFDDRQFVAVQLVKGLWKFEEISPFAL